MMKWRKHKSPGRRWLAGIPIPCAPIRAETVPTGPAWVHEIKHDGYRLIVRNQANAVRIITRGGFDWTDRYPRIIAGARSMLHSRQHDKACFLYAFDLVELNGTDIRHPPLELRKQRLENLLGGMKDNIVYSEHVDLDGSAMFAAACKMGLEGIISKLRDKAYVSGPCKHWIKVKNPTAPAMLRLID